VITKYDSFTCQNVLMSAAASPLVCSNAWENVVSVSVVVCFETSVEASRIETWKMFETDGELGKVVSSRLTRGSMGAS